MSSIVCVWILQEPVTLQPLPVMTSKHFQWETASNNHYYVSICLMITSALCLNPIGLFCACIGFCFARKVYTYAWCKNCN